MGSINSSSTATAYINSTDLTINKEYRVGWELEQLSPTTSIVDLVTLLGPQLPLLISRVVSLTPPDGSYLAWAWLHEVVNSTSQSWLDTDATNFTVGNNSTSTGGNNTGGNSSTNGCGNMTSGRLSDNWNFTEVQEDTLFDYVNMQTVFWIMVLNTKLCIKFGIAMALAQCTHLLLGRPN